jgi:hypothetical protein
MNAAGENALEAQTLDLKARPLERTEVVPAKSGLDSPFAAAGHIEKTSILRQGKPFSANRTCPPDRRTACRGPRRPSGR